MCWDISLHTDIEIVTKAFPGVIDRRKFQSPNPLMMENVQAIEFPAYPILYRENETGDLALTEMEWGVLPLYLDDPKDQIIRRRNQVNIRSERILGERNSLWYRLRNQRCLIPVSGIYEHRTINTWKKKVPYYVAEKDRDIFYVPALYQWHEHIDEEGVLEKVGSFGMLTRAANSIMAQIHNAGPNRHRMPLFLPEKLELLWVSDLSEVEMIKIFNYEIPEEKLLYYPVYTLRGYPIRPDGKHRFDPYEWSHLPPLGNDDPIPTQQSLF